MLAKYSGTGDLAWAATAGGTGNDDAYNISTDLSENIYLTGNFQSPSLVFGYNQLDDNQSMNGYVDIFFAKLNPLIPASIHQINLNSNNIFIYPNPANTGITITSTDSITSVSITNLIDQTQYNKSYNSEQVQINIADLQPGIYFVKINCSVVKKILKK